MVVFLSKAWAKLLTAQSKRSRGKQKAPLFTSQDDELSTSSIEIISPIISRAESEDLIVGLWKRVWLGLYEINLEESRYHSDRLKALYYGAGLSLSRDSYKEIYQNLFRRFNRFSPRWDNGIASLKLSDDISIFTIHSIYEILMAYEGEIYNLRRLYSLLQRKQLRLKELYLAKSSPSEMDRLQKDFNKIAGPMGRRIAFCDIRTNSVNDLIREELEKKQNNRESVKSKYIYDLAFPERIRGGFHSGPSR